MRDLNMKELRFHTLRGDIQSIGMDGWNMRGIRSIIQGRYVNSNSEIPITIEEFNRILKEEYEKVEAWRRRTASK